MFNLIANACITVQYYCCCGVMRFLCTLFYSKALESTDKEWFTIITSSLNQEMTTKLHALFIAAEQRRQAMGKGYGWGEDTIVCFTKAILGVSVLPQLYIFFTCVSCQPLHCCTIKISNFKKGFKSNTSIFETLQKLGAVQN